MMKQLKPLREKAKYYKPIESAIVEFFKNAIFSKLLDILNSGTGQYYNDSDVIKQALLKGQIQYVDGRFTGKFSIAITKELKNLGAKWDSRSGGFVLSPDKIPQEMQQIIGLSQSLFKQLYDNILTELATIDIPKSLETFTLDTFWYECLEDMSAETYETLKDDISIIPEFTEEMKKSIAENYTNNMKKYIQDFSEQEISKLRKLVEENTFDKGYRAEALHDIIQREFEVSENKARFLARQETSLLVSQFREERYKSVGITKYKWSSSHDNRVRSLHKELDGSVFEWDNPPVIDERTGERGHPGQAFGCRCIAVPLIG